MIDFRRLSGQLSGFADYRRAEDGRHAERLGRGVDALGECDAWEALGERAAAATSGPLRALAQSDPRQPHTAPPRPPTVTVVATDGSQIFPDRHVEPACYLLNIGRVALHYGTLDPPLIQAEPSLRYREADMDSLVEDDDATAAPDFTAEVVSALRDELELHWLFRTAADEQRSGRPIVALADGTLIRWMLRGMKNRALEDTLIARYVAELERFRQAGIPVASFVSRPGNAEVVNLLRLHRGEADWEPAPDSLRGLLDRHLFERTLEPGQRSALFLSRSKVLDQYGPHRIAAFYVHVGTEIGRVEMPEWATLVPGWTDLVHAVILDQAEKGGGYPIALQEAHQRAVVRAEETEIFHRILARTVRAAGGNVPTYSGKAASKRAPRV